jgi:hypothetical protein
MVTHNIPTHILDIYNMSDSEEFEAWLQTQPVKAVTVDIWGSDVYEGPCQDWRMDFHDSLKGWIWPQEGYGLTECGHCIADLTGDFYGPTEGFQITEGH